MSSIEAPEELTTNTSTTTGMSSPTARRKLVFKHSMRDIKEGIPQKKLVYDTIHNNVTTVLKLYDKKNLDKELQKILADMQLCVAFKDWLKVQQCEENLNFWIAVELYKREEDQSKRAQSRKEIYQKFFLESSLNIDSELLTTMTDILQAENYSKDVYDEAQQAVFHLLETNCVPRFLQSTQYLSEKENGKGNGHQALKKTLSLNEYTLAPKLSKGYWASVSQDSLNINKLFALNEREKWGQS